MKGAGRWSLLLSLVLIAVAGFFGYWLGTDHDETGTVAHPGRPECPHDWDFKRGQLPAVGPIGDIPEYNDCQRFIVYDGAEARYDELYAIFAILDENARALAAPDIQFMGGGQVEDTVKGGDTARAMDAVSANDPGQLEADSPIDLAQRFVTGEDGLAVAEIYAEGEYEPLGITSMFSCLILIGDGRWSARMVPVAGAEVDCREVRPDSGKGLTVHAVDVPARGPAPPVARWAWHDGTRKQYMIVSCGSSRRWEVGDVDLPAPAPPAADLAVPPTRYVKGWYDQQYLAATDEDGNTVPTRILGTIYPDADLDRRDAVADFQEESWVPVAHVSIEVPDDPTDLELGALEEYKRNLNFEVTGPGAALDPDGDLNTIYFRHGPFSVLPTLTVEDQQRVLECPESEWWAMIVSAGANPDTVYRCVKRREHPSGFQVPGTARWRWLASDETTWSRCQQGCCELPQ